MKNHKKYNFIELTKNEFQIYSKTEITNEEAKEIQKNLFGFIDLLLEWDKKEKNNEAQI